MTNSLLNFIVLMTSPEGSEGGGTSFFIMILLMIVVFYFFMIRPQMRKTKEQKKFREGLKKGDKIITIGGIHGKILEVKDTTLIIETEGQGRLKIEKTAASVDSSVQIPEEQK
ncbi:MAG: preprotein translocase subunit YajC [Bacteroidales bacterium]